MLRLLTPYVSITNTYDDHSDFNIVYGDRLIPTAAFFRDSRKYYAQLFSLTRGVVEVVIFEGEVCTEEEFALREAQDEQVTLTRRAVTAREPSLHVDHGVPADPNPFGVNSWGDLEEAGVDVPSIGAMLHTRPPRVATRAAGTTMPSLDYEPNPFMPNGTEENE